MYLQNELYLPKSKEEIIKISNLFIHFLLANQKIKQIL